MKKQLWILEEKIAIEKGLEKHSGKKIVQYEGLLKHIAKHESEYISIESCEYTINNIASIIKDYDYVYYNKEKQGLEYYKKLIEKVCAIVQIVDKRELYVASVYPVREEKISNRKYKDQYAKYVITEEEYNNKEKDAIPID